MVTGGTLGARQARVLRAVVRDYIRTGEPVGSSTLAGRYRLQVSAATIRNDMAALEELGYLTHPHTSAGRIPTDLGYRFFVDTLSGLPRLSETQRHAIAVSIDERVADVEDVMRRTAHILSRMTRYAAVALSPTPGREHVFVGGVGNIAREEVFEHRETLRRLFDALDEEATILRFLRDLATDEEDITVRIGRENPLAAMREASVVVAWYRVGDRPAGSIAVIGPTRMEYPTAMSTVAAVAHRLTDVIETLGG